jgi:hypothetical protein
MKGKIIEFQFQEEESHYTFNVKLENGPTINNVLEKNLKKDEIDIISIRLNSGAMLYG